MAAIIKHLVDDKDMVLIPKLIFEKKNRRDTKLRDAMHRVYRHLQNNLVVEFLPDGDGTVWCALSHSNLYPDF